MYYFSNVFERELYPVVNIHFADAEYLRVELAVNRIGPLPADSRYSFHHAYNRTRRCGVAVGGEACLNGAAENLLMYNPNDTGYTYYAIFKLPILTATPDTDPITHSITVRPMMSLALRNVAVRFAHGEIICSANCEI